RSNAFVASFDGGELDMGGQLDFVTQLGDETTSGVDGKLATDNAATAIAVDGGGQVWLAGNTDGTFPGSSVPNAGGLDFFVSRIDRFGHMRSTKQIGATSDDQLDAMVAVPNWHVVVTGSTRDQLPGSDGQYVSGNDTFAAAFEGPSLADSDSDGLPDTWEQS